MSWCCIMIDVYNVIYRKAYCCSMSAPGFNPMTFWMIPRGNRRQRTRAVRNLSHSLKFRYQREMKLLKQPAETLPHLSMVLWTREERMWSYKTWWMNLIHSAVQWIQMSATTAYFRQVLWEEILMLKRIQRFKKNRQDLWDTYVLVFCLVWQ